MRERVLMDLYTISNNCRPSWGLFGYTQIHTKGTVTPKRGVELGNLKILTLAKPMQKINYLNVQLRFASVLLSLPQKGVMQPRFQTYQLAYH